MKTVLQKMLQDVEYAEKLPNVSPLTLQIYNSIENMIIRGIPLEKQQIIDAYEQGIDEAYSRFNSGMNMSYWKDTNKEQYYEQTYK